jgi:hypothetical protein
MRQSIILVNASPRTEGKSSSDVFLTMLDNRIVKGDIHIKKINVLHSINKQMTKQDFEIIFQANAIVFAFPLYFFCIPGLLMRFLDDYYQFYQKKEKQYKGTKIYAIVNCAFPEPNINEEAVRIIKSFCRHIKADFRFGILIGGGRMITMTKDAFFMRKTISNLEHALDFMANDAINGGHSILENVLISPNFPKRLYYFLVERLFTNLAKKNGLKRKDLYQKPYLKV